MLSFLSFIIKSILATGGFLSLAAVIVTLCPKHLSNYNYQKHGAALRYLIPLFAFFGWTVLSVGGLEVLLWFVPNSWGRVGEEGWVTTRKSWSLFVGFWLGAFILHRQYEAMHTHDRLEIFKEDLTSSGAKR